MRKVFLTLILVLGAIIVFAQDEIERLVFEGIDFHKQGNYEKAIETYNKALKIDNKSPLANYELALTYMTIGDYENSIKHSDIVIIQKDNLSLQAYTTKGSSLSSLNKTDEAIDVFLEAISLFGDNYLLYYNLGFVFFKIKEYDNAEISFTNAIITNSDHASSHLLLAYTMHEKNQRVQSTLCLHYFLLIEPNSERAKLGYQFLIKNLSGNVERTNGNTINIRVLENSLENEFGAADLMLSMLEASNSFDENNDKSEEALFIENTTSFFNVLGELRKEENSGIWWIFYVPFFYELANSEHIETYCHFISMSSNVNSANWLNNNPDKLEDFRNWLQND